MAKNKSASMQKNGAHAKLDEGKLAVAGAVLGAVWLGLLGLTTMGMGWGYGMMNMMGSIYLGYGPTLPGVLIGMLWGAIDGAICGYALAWIYNRA
ncbi:MAG: hypothetical protein V1728_05505 [Candidatus Micrarchaeota archaeon]